MENQEIPTSISQEQMIMEIREDMRKAKNYMKWQLIITVGLVVIPLLAALFIIPFAMKSLTSAYLGSSVDSGSQAESLLKLIE